MLFTVRQRFMILLGVAVLAAWAGTGAVAEPPNDFHFSILGDRTGTATPQIYGRVWREIDLLGPDFVINVGDTIQGGNDEKVVEEWEALRPVRERYKRYPLFFTAGNHDIFSPHSRQVFQRMTGRPAHYSFTHQQALFIVLDNSQTDELSEAQLDFLAKELEANKHRDPKFVFFHKPFWMVYVRLGSGEFRLHQLALQHGVDYVVSGHGHQFMRMARDGVVYMQVGSSGGDIMRRGPRRGEGFEQGWFYHHVWVRVKGAETRFTVKELDGMMGQGRMFRAEDWDEQGPKFNIADPAITEKPGT